MRSILALVPLALLAACNNAPVSDAKAQAAAAEAEKPKAHSLGKFPTAAAANDAALTHCTKNGFKGDYFVTQPIEQKGKATYDGMVMLSNPCVTQDKAS